MARRVFLVVYGLSGAAALLYQVVWSRLLTLHLGHTVAAVSTVLAAFMGGLAVGAVAAGAIAPRLRPRLALTAYAVLEAVIAVCALLLPAGLAALQPLLRMTYADGIGELFAIARVVTSLGLIALPAATMGATLPLAVRWFASRAEHGARDAGVLYAVNAFGAALGAGLTGFVLLPALGLRLTMLMGVAANVVAAAVAWRIASAPESEIAATEPVGQAYTVPPGRRKAAPYMRVEDRSRAALRRWLAAIALGLSGAVALLYEVVWTRALALVLGPTIYAFSTMRVAFIVGVACGATAASRVADRVSRPLVWLASMLMVAALGTFGAWFMVSELPLTIAGIVSAPDATLGSVIARQAVLVAALLLPMTLAFGAAFPFAVAAAARRAETLSADVALVYAVNTVGAVTGALAASFLVVPALGLQRSIVLGGLLLVLGGVAIAMLGTRRIAVRLGLAAAGAVLAVAGLLLPSWNSKLVSSGAYKYAVDTVGDLQTRLEAGELLYYGEGAAGTVSVRRVAGTTSLAIDGKVDASNGADMVTQKLLAHVPLLLHASPRDVAVIGLGSGVTVGAALRHPVRRVDVVEISPEVVAASSLFRTENRNALADPRTRLIVGDGRTHLTLARQAYDVIISEPSNPWMAGNAALFTREFFTAARERLTPGGVFCQRAHTDDITEADLRSIVATFRDVFPNGTMWLVGRGDLLLIGGDAPVVDRLPQIMRTWTPEVAADLGASHVSSLGVLSLFLADGPGVATFGTGTVQTDDQLGLEFSAPRGIYGASKREVVKVLRTLAASDDRPPVVAASIAAATPAMWREVGLMHLEARAADRAYDALARAAAADPTDPEMLGALARVAAASGDGGAAKALLDDLTATDPGNAAARVALSRLHAAAGDSDAALLIAADAVDIDPANREAREQLASVVAARADAVRLEPVVQTMVRDDPERPGTLYYLAVLHFLRGELRDAIAVGERVTATDPRNARAHNLLGAALARFGLRDRARAAFQASLAANPADPSALANLGMFELEAADANGAAALFAEALLLDPHNQPALAGLTEALIRLGEGERASRIRPR
jgi:spermidine synthase